MKQDKILFTSTHKTIGHTNWRVQVFEREDCIIAPSRSGLSEFTRGTDRFTRYQYFDGQRQQWKNETEHPRYNPHDGTYAGLPKGLRALYYDNLTAIDYYLHTEDTQDDNNTQPAAFAMVEGEGAPQYTFDIPADTQLSLL